MLGLQKLTSLQASCMTFLYAADMRLTSQQLFAIKESFKECFSYGDTLWLFGSRVDDSKRGGDIDLYIETDVADGSSVFKKKLKFIGLLQRKIGEQKIDVVIKMASSANDLLIYREAQRTGILLMKKEVPLEYHIATADRHAKRLQEALDHVIKLSPVTAADIETLPSVDISYLDMLSMRFSKLQDVIGARIFSSILEIMGDESVVFIDKLNKLEKLYFLDVQGKGVSGTECSFSVAWWMNLRDLRNDITHDYPDETEVIAEHVNGLVIKAQELLTYWAELKPKVVPLVEKQIASSRL